MIRALSILTAIVALAVSAAPVASAGTPEAAKGACSVPGFMDYTDDSCMAKPKAPARAGKVANLGAADDISTFSIASSEVFELNTAKGRGAGKSLRRR